MVGDNRKIDPLDFIPLQERDSVRKVFTEVEANKEKIIFFQDEPSKHLYLVTGGTIEISNMYPDGRVYIHEFLGAGDVFGEGVLYGQGKYPYTAQAREDATALRTGRGEVAELMVKYESFREEMIRILGRKIDLAYSKFRCIAGEKVDRRITCVLMRYVDLRGIDEDCGMVIDTPLTNRDIAGLVGSTEETVSRVMSKLKKNDIITMENKHVVVKDEEALTEFFNGL